MNNTLVSGSKFQVPGDVEEDPTPTQKIWRPVAELDAAHEQAFQDLQSAMTHNDVVAAERARRRIAQIELEQQQAHAVARAYALSKVHR